MEITAEGVRLLTAIRREQAAAVAGLLARLDADELELVIAALEPLERIALAHPDDDSCR